MQRPALQAGCPAVLEPVASSRNSLRALRALRSDNRDKSGHEARCAPQWTRRDDRCQDNALALSLANSSALMVPASSSVLASAMSAAGDFPATVLM